ncbi:MAG: CRISPR-associated endonuclease Cas2 [Bacteroidetes bacterium]|nr:CRISPR-associated endonuclease Cas2 [Bacteroidota bacterium]
MYIIAVYDMQEERVMKMCKLLRRYLRHEQRSVFEGELTEQNYGELIRKAEELINPETDNLLFFQCATPNYITKKKIGKSDIDLPENFL